MRADEWNDRFPIGTRVSVKSSPVTTFECLTTSMAWDVFGGSTLVKVEGRSGGYDLECITPLVEE